MTGGGFDAVCDWPADDAGLEQAARAAGVVGWLHPGTHPGGWSETRALASRTGGQIALGLHPWWAQDAEPSAIEEVPRALSQADPPIVGEIGLDHLRARDAADRARQRAAFEAQLQWAIAQDRPVILHVVRAGPEVLQVLANLGLPEAGAAWHNFVGNSHQATRALSLGCHLSVGPLVARPSGHKVRAAVRRCPASRLLIETDGRPDALPSVAEAVSDIVGGSAVEVLHRTGYNARRLYRCLLEPHE